MKRVSAVSGVRVVLVVIFALIPSSAAVADSAPSSVGEVVGEVATCANAAEIPAPNVAVGVDGGSGDMVRTDARGLFSIALAPGQYTIVATADDGSTASRFEVPVEEGETLNIGTLDLNAGITGCGFDTDLPPVPLANPTPTPTTDGSAAGA